LERGHTHRLLVSAYLLRGDEFLLLHRATEPLLWTPPGGHLQLDEAPLAGVVREVREETGLEVDVLGPASVWYGDLGKGPAVSIDFLCRYRSGEVRLSEEHDAICWSTLKQLRQGQPELGRHPLSYTVEGFAHAYRLFEQLR